MALHKIQLTSNLATHIFMLKSQICISPECIAVTIQGLEGWKESPLTLELLASNFNFIKLYHATCHHLVFHIIM